MELLESFAPGVLLALAASYMTYFFANRSTQRTEKRGICREAAADLAAPLRDLRSVTRMWGRRDLTQADVQVAVVAWARACDRQKHRLPDDLVRMCRGVREAAGEVFGGVVSSERHPEMADFPLAEPDFKWQEHAEEYMSDVLDALVRWGDGQPLKDELLGFDAWLDATDRYRRGGHNVRILHFT